MKNKFLVILIIVLFFTGCRYQKGDLDLKNDEIESVGISEDYLSSEDLKVDDCDTSGQKKANVKVDIGYDSENINREYYGYTNESTQLVYVHADEIILQDDDTEDVTSKGRYCQDEAKVPGVERDYLDEGHVIADSLGGVSNAYNITAQGSNLNRTGVQSQMEEHIRDSLYNGAVVTDFSYYIYYDSENTQIPSSYEVEYLVNDEKFSYSFENNY